MVKIAAKWFLIGQGIIWSLLTVALVLMKLDLHEKEIIFAWIIAILFSVAMTVIESRPKKDA